MSETNGLARAAKASRPTARQRGESTADTRPTIRSTVDLPRATNADLGAAATRAGLRRQAVLAALAAAYADGDDRAVAIVTERTGG